MARSPKADTRHNNGPLSDDDIAALTAFHGQQVRTLRLDVERAALALKTARTAVNGQFKLVAKDLTYTRIDFEDLLSKQDMDESAFIAAEERRTKRLSLGGLPVGTQLDMFAKTVGDTADDKANAYEDGRLAGLYGKDCDPPGKIDPIFHTDWLGGWEAGEKQLAGMMARAKVLLAERAAAPKPGELAAELDEEDDTDLDPDTIAKKARKLKAGGFLEPTPEERSFAPTEAAGELADA